MLVREALGTGYCADLTHCHLIELLLLHEQLHWIILMAAFILSDTGEGEQPMIPESLMQLSGSQVND
jgi:hypothetical protein